MFQQRFGDKYFCTKHWADAIAPQQKKDKKHCWLYQKLKRTGIQWSSKQLLQRHH